MQLAEKDRAGQ